MNAEEHWYNSYRTVRKHGGGEERLPPLCERMSRKSSSDQWAAIIDLAIEIATGEAGWRHATISLTGERYWFFRGGWWLLTARMERRARRIVDAARNSEARRAAALGSVLLDDRDVAARLRRWKAGRKWSRIAAGAAKARTSEQARAAVQARWKKHRKTKRVPEKPNDQVARPAPEKKL
jgi:hypothetical protein